MRSEVQGLGRALAMGKIWLSSLAHHVVLPGGPNP